MDWSKVLEIVKIICICSSSTILVVSALRYVALASTEIFNGKRNKKIEKTLLTNTTSNKKTLKEINKKIDKILKEINIKNEKNNNTDNNGNTDNN